MMNVSVIINPCPFLGSVVFETMESQVVPIDAWILSHGLIERVHPVIILHLILKMVFKKEISS